jgi:hypothetical protein
LETGRYLRKPRQSPTLPHLLAPRRGGPLPGVAFSREAVANAFVTLGLLPEPRAEEILAEHRPGLEAEGFRVAQMSRNIQAGDACGEP